MLWSYLQSLTQHHITDTQAGSLGLAKRGKERQRSDLNIWQLRREGVPTVEATVNQKLRVLAGHAGCLCPMLSPGRGAKDGKEADDSKGQHELGPSHGLSLHCANQPDVGYQLPQHPCLGPEKSNHWPFLLREKHRGEVSTLARGLRCSQEVWRMKRLEIGWPGSFYL